MTIKEALFQSIASAIQDLLDYLNTLPLVKQSGKGGQLWAEFLRVFLSGKEDKADFAFAVKATAIAHDLFADYPDANVGDPVHIIDFEKALIHIHKFRGTEQGITEDIKRICNNINVSVTYYGQDQCGWIGDVTSPEFTPALEWNPDTTLVYLDLDNMVIIVGINSGNRSNEEVANIIRHDFVPVKYNLQTTISKT